MASTPDNTNASLAVSPQTQQHGDKGAMSPDSLMVVWTWATFAIVALVLYKVAWKPILSALDARESRIRNSLDDAKRAREELHNIEETCDAMKVEAANESKKIISKARVDATKVAAHVETKANEKIAIMYENAERDIEAMTNKVVSEISKDQADIIINLSSALVAKNIDSNTNRSLTDKLLKEL